MFFKAIIKFLDGLVFSLRLSERLTKTTLGIASCSHFVVKFIGRLGLPATKE